MVGYEWDGIIYYEGNQYAQVTGGYNKADGEGIAAYIQFQETCIYIVGYVGCKNGYISTKNAIIVPKIFTKAKLRYDVKKYGDYNLSGTLYFQLISKSGVIMASDSMAFSNELSVREMEIQLDPNSDIYKAGAVIKVYVYNNSGYYCSVIDVYKIWFE